MLTTVIAPHTQFPELSQVPYSFAKSPVPSNMDKCDDVISATEATLDNVLSAGRSTTNDR